MIMEFKEIVASPDFPTSGPFSSYLDVAKQLLVRQIEEIDGWTTTSDSQGLKIEAKDQADPYAIPIVRGSTVVKNATTDSLSGVINLPGMRKLWDPRMETGFMVERFSRSTITFYTKMKGFGWIVWPRDLFGAQAIIQSQQPNQEIFIVQTSVEDEERAPAQSGFVRGKLHVAGWRIKPDGDHDVRLDYLVSVSLGGAIPLAMMQLLSTELPSCALRVRETFYSTGFPPYVRATEQDWGGLISQTETFDPETRVWRAIFVIRGPGKFQVVYDNNRMHSKGIDVNVEGEGRDSISMQDGSLGSFTVVCHESDPGKRFDLVISPG